MIAAEVSSLTQLCFMHLISVHYSIKLKSVIYVGFFPHC